MKSSLLFGCIAAVTFTACTPSSHGEQNNPTEQTSEENTSVEYSAIGYLNGQSGDVEISKEEFLNSTAIEVKDNEGNPIPYAAISFDLTSAVEQPDGNTFETTISSNTADFNEKQKNVIANSKPGQKFYIENIKATNADGENSILAAPINLEIAE
jgi:hypothetical protein